MDHPPRRMLSARYDGNHVPRIPVPIHDRRLVSFALPDRLDFEAEPVAGRPGTGDVELLGAVATANYCATSFGAKATRLTIRRRSVSEEKVSKVGTYSEPSMGIDHANPLDQSQPHGIAECELGYKHRTNHMHPSLSLCRLLCTQERIW